MKTLLKIIATPIPLALMWLSCWLFRLFEGMDSRNWWSLPLWMTIWFALVGSFLGVVIMWIGPPPNESS